MNEQFVEHKLGEIVKGCDIEKKSNKNDKFVWRSCITCGKERWVRLRKGKPYCDQCCHCSNSKFKEERNGNWKGGKINDNGYIRIKLLHGDFFYLMANHVGYALEHRLVIAKHLGRCLQPWEVVHHKDGNKTNNQIGNLELDTRNGHTSAHNKGYRDGYRKGLGDGRLNQIQELKRRIAKLEIDNKLLKWQISQFRGESCQIKISR